MAELTDPDDHDVCEHDDFIDPAAFPEGDLLDSRAEQANLDA